MQSSDAASAASLPNGDRFTTEVGDLLFSLQALLIREAQGGAAVSASTVISSGLEEPLPSVAPAPQEAPVVASELPIAVASEPAVEPASPPATTVDPAFTPQVTVLPEATPVVVHPAEPEPALFDPSTGAPNLNGLRKDIERQGSRVSAALVSLDINPLADIRATVGEASAEAVLRAIVEAVPFALRSQDQVYRTGLDELTLCVPDAGLSDAAVMSLRLQMAVKDVLMRRELPAVILSIRPYQQVAA
jgi:Diguanylate cyclase, GGDEF domain